MGASSKSTRDLVPQGVSNVQVQRIVLKRSVSVVSIKPWRTVNVKTIRFIYLVFLAVGLGLFGLYICTLRVHDYCLQKPEQGIWSPEIRDTGSHELSHSVGDWTCVLWMNSQCSYSLSYLSGLENSDTVKAFWQIWKVILNVLYCLGPSSDFPDLDSSVGGSLLGSYLVWKGWSRWPLLACKCPSQVQQGT